MFCNNQINKLPIWLRIYGKIKKNLLFSMCLLWLRMNKWQSVRKIRKKVYLWKIKKINLKAQNRFFLPRRLILDKMNWHLILFFFFFFLYLIIITLEISLHYLCNLRDVHSMNNRHELYRIFLCFSIHLVGLLMNSESRQA